MLHLTTDLLTCWKTLCQCTWLMSTSVCRHLLYKYVEWQVPRPLLLSFSLDSLPHQLVLAEDLFTQCTILQTEWLLNDQWANLWEKTSAFLLQLPFSTPSLKSSPNYFCLCVHLKILVLRSISYLAKWLQRDIRITYSPTLRFILLLLHTEKVLLKSYFCSGDAEVLWHDLIVDYSNTAITKYFP